MSTTSTTMVTAAGVGPERYQDNYLAKDTAPAQARRDVALYLNTWNLDHLVDTAQSIVSELVTNAIMHTASHRVGVSVTRTGSDAVRIVVTDSSRRTPASVLDLYEDAEEIDEHGRGLLLVDALATRWGSQRLVTGKRVWAELDTTKDTTL